MKAKIAIGSVGLALVLSAPIGTAEAASDNCSLKANRGKAACWQTRTQRQIPAATSRHRRALLPDSSAKGSAGEQTGVGLRSGVAPTGASVARSAPSRATRSNAPVAAPGPTNPGAGAPPAGAEDQSVSALAFGLDGDADAHVTAGREDVSSEVGTDANARARAGRINAGAAIDAHAAAGALSAGDSSVTQIDDAALAASVDATAVGPRRFARAQAGIRAAARTKRTGLRALIDADGKALTKRGDVQVDGTVSVDRARHEHRAEVDARANVPKLLRNREGVALRADVRREGIRVGARATSPGRKGADVNLNINSGADANHGNFGGSFGGSVDAGIGAGANSGLNAGADVSAGASTGGFGANVGVGLGADVSAGGLSIGADVGAGIGADIGGGGGLK